VLRLSCRRIYAGRVIVFIFTLVMAVLFFREAVSLIRMDSSFLTKGWSRISSELLVRALERGLPATAVSGSGTAGSQWVQAAVQAVTGADLLNPREVLASQFKVAETIPGPSAPVVAAPFVLEDENADAHVESPDAGLPAEIAPAPEPVPVSGKPLIGIYNTHNAETYVPTDGKDKLEGKNAGVVKVAETLATTLEKNYGLATVRSDVIHDYPSFARSYGNSELTAKNMLEKYPSLVALVDVHRDAGMTRRETIKINGRDSAKLLFIVGSNTRLEHPKWRDNLEFATLLHGKLEELYPGLSKGVRVQDGRYNQHLHPRAILLEVGGVNNSLEEARYAVTLFARALAEVLKEQRVIVP